MGVQLGQEEKQLWKSCYQLIYCAEWDSQCCYLNRLMGSSYESLKTVLLIINYFFQFLSFISWLINLFVIKNGKQYKEWRKYEIEKKKSKNDLNELFWVIESCFQNVSEILFLDRGHFRSICARRMSFWLRFWHHFVVVPLWAIWGDWVAIYPCDSDRRGWPGRHCRAAA